MSAQHAPIGKELDTEKRGVAAVNLIDNLQSRVIGQAPAVAELAESLETYWAGLTPTGRPVSNFLFLGPTGTGKTRTVEALAESLVDNPKAVIKIDCGEFQHSHEIAKLIGSPPGYLGHRETHPLLSQEVLNQFHTETVKLSFVLFDEIEKASDAVWNLLLGIMDKATLTLGDNRKVSFERSMIFLTSNLGVKEMDAYLEVQEELKGRGKKHSAEEEREELNRIGFNAAREKFTPEFMNRLDMVLVYKRLRDEELREILDLELGYVLQRVYSNGHFIRPFVFKVDDDAKDKILKEGTDLKFGARHLKRAVERLVVRPLAKLITTAQIGEGDIIRVGVKPGNRALSFFKIKGDATMPEIQKFLNDERIKIPQMKVVEPKRAAATERRSSYDRYDR